MNSVSVTPAARPAGRSLLRLVAGIPVACFLGALVSDITYAWTANIIWADFSAWLLAGGMAVGALALIAGAVRLLASRRHAGAGIFWPTALGVVVVLVFALFDNLVHSRDAWTSVVPMGLILSAVTVAAMLATLWLDMMVAGREPATATYGRARR